MSNPWGYNGNANVDNNQLLQSAALFQQQAQQHRIIHSSFRVGCQQCVVLYNLGNHMNRSNIMAGNIDMYTSNNTANNMMNINPNIIASLTATPQFIS